MGHFHAVISCMLPWEMSCLSVTLQCVDFMYVTMGDVLFEWDTSRCRFHVCYHGGCPVTLPCVDLCRTDNFPALSIYLLIGRFDYSFKECRKISVCCRPIIHPYV